ncbi:MAG: glutamate racemase [Leptospiraceae bacterium]|nr:MAG: glutamate racemase [Leptospiraceae bacterium]
MNSKSIGIFDSGLGGLTVLAELIHQLPEENYIYVGDTARVPYGSRSKDTVIKYSLEIASFLIKQDIKLLIVACNTASAYALDILKKHFDIPIIGVIEPGVEAFFNQSSQTSVAVIGTRATIKSNAYTNLIHYKDPEISVFSKPCPLFVPLVEEGWINHPITKEVIKEYLQEIIDKNIVDLILGCTHYPLLKQDILEIYPQFNLIDSSKETAKLVKKLITENKTQNYNKNKKNSITIYLTDITDKVQFLEKLFLEKDGFIIVKDHYAILKDNPEIKFPILLKELSLEQLVIV